VSIARRLVGRSKSAARATHSSPLPGSDRLNALRRWSTGAAKKSGRIPRRKSAQKAQSMCQEETSKKTNSDDWLSAPSART
jgi:hypothetical protein